MINNTSKIVILGKNDNTSKTLYDCIKRFLQIDNGRSDPSKGNYLETSFDVDDHRYFIVNISSILFFSKDDDEIEKEIKTLNRDLVLSSDIVYLVINTNTTEIDYYLNLQKYLCQNKKEYLVIFSSNRDNEEEVKDAFLTNVIMHRILSSCKKNYFFSSLRNERSLVQMKQFMCDEFSFDGDHSKISNSFDVETTPKLTIFGPPNSGKSTLLNSLLGKKRSIVTPIAGTTQEDVVSLFGWKDSSFEIKDTEGIVINKRNDRTVLNDCEMSWVVLDSTKTVTKKTLQIISLAEKCNRAIIIILNKADIATEEQIDQRKEEISLRLKSFSFVPVVSISASKKSNFPQLLAILENSVKQSQLTFSKSLLSQQFSKLLEKNPPAAIYGKHLRIYYGIHEKGFVHKFVIFVNNPELVHFSYHRYIVNHLRKNLQIDSLPIRLFFKKS